MLVFSILSLALMAIDQLSDIFDSARSGLAVLVYPIVMVADYPNKASEALGDVFDSRSVLQEDNLRLESELLILKVKTQKMSQLAAENARLRALLHASAKLQDKVLVAEMVGVDPDPRRHEVILDKGADQKVFVGQPVLDAQGLIGQVIEVNPLTSRVLLLSDQSHFVPVQVVRSNLRLIARGTGTSRQLEVNHVQETADIREGDLLVSSGMGGRFPVGYPVGTIKNIEFKPGKSFAVVTALPSGLLDRSRHVLLVFVEDNILIRGEASGG
ncbi:MAG: rod shape-determining protein MreC [Pseudomonadales bacterium]|nr:rod shape-determining protein MreC [Pseudomonadales bacterium]